MSARWMAFMLLASLPAAAQNAGETYPARAVRLILPLAPGGGMDTVARPLGQKLGDNLGQTIVIDNRAGGGGTIGIELASQAAPDGYTLLMISSSTAIYPQMYKARYDLARDFMPVTQVVNQPYLLMVHPSLPVKTVADLVAHAKANPRKLNYGSAGNGSMTHLAMELFRISTNIEIVHIPYKGMGAAFPDLIAGNTQMSFSSIVSVQPHIANKRLRALAVSSPRRAAAAPDVPTVVESGVPGYAVTQWYGIVVPARTPHAVVDRLQWEIAKALNSPDMTSRLAADGAEAAATTSQQFGAHLKAESEKWAQVLKQTGIRGD